MLKRIRNWLRGESAPPHEDASSTGPEVPVGLSADRPISLPHDDLYDLDPFAKTIAASILSMAPGEGIAIGVHGPWGAGKSSAANLIRHHLKESNLPGAATLKVVEFSPWWFNGPDALAMAFLTELGGAIGGSLSEAAREAFKKLGRRLGRAGDAVGAVTDAIAPGAGALTGGALSTLGSVLEGKEAGIADEHATLAASLRNQNSRFLVIIDDVDRLNPDEALLVFKLVKSVGRLPNVMYLLVFDRELAEAAVATQFPSEGPHYLEKIIQASFEVPVPARDDLLAALGNMVGDLMGTPSEGDTVQFMNVFHDAVAPFVKTPRDLVRLVNNLRVTWPSVAADVDPADFLAMETMRLLKPAVHRSIRDNAEIICGIQDELRPLDKAAYDRLFLAGVPEAEQEIIKRALMRLFPRLQAPWTNHFYGAHQVSTWNRYRRVCSISHFPTYVRFSPGATAIPAAEVNQLIASAGNPDEVAAALRNAIRQPWKRGASRASALLGELELRANEIAEGHTQSVVQALFTLGDELNLQSDRGGAFATVDNTTRIHWLLNSLVTDRLSLDDRDRVYLSAIDDAALGWLVDFVSRCIEQHARPSDRNTSSNGPLVSAGVAEGLRGVALTRLRAAQADGSLLRHPRLEYLLYRWRDFAGDEAYGNVRRWLDEELLRDETVVAIATGFVSEGWSHQMGDRVARRIYNVSVEGMSGLMDTSLLLKQVRQLLTRPDLDAGQRSALAKFNSAWLTSEKEEARRRARRATSGGTDVLLDPDD